MSEPARIIRTKVCLSMNREVREITSISDWLSWREKDVTASRVACLFDLHPYLNLTQLIDIMRGDTGTGTSSVPDSPAMRRGRILEPAVAVAVEEERPEWKPLIKATTYHRLPEIRLGATPDYLVSDDGLIEIKTTSPQQWERQHGQIPLWQTLQCLTELMVTGRAWGAVACMVCSPSYPVHIAMVPRHPAAEARILDAVAEFWKRWDAGEHPQPQTAAGLAEMVSDGSHVDFSGDNEMLSLLAERAELVPVRRDAEKRIDEIDDAIKARLGPASTAWCPGWSLTFKPQTRKETVLPEHTFRVLRVRAVIAGGGEEGAA